MSPLQEPSSSNSFNHGWTYDVFVSFHGEDTRYSFTGNLCNALHQKGINTFKDDSKLKKGEGISPSLLKAIDESRIAIIVFSQNYASSSWCLDELVRIMERMKEKGQLVRPVFYYVDPSDVRHQRRSFRSSMTKHEENLNIDKERVCKWRTALKEAANLSGWHFKYGYEFEFIQRIAEEISSKLNLTSLHIADHPVGLDYRMSKVVSLLGIKSNDEVCMVGIYGFGGIGKTTIARSVYNLIANKFEGSSFLADVRENSMKRGLVQLQETLLFHLLGENIKLSDVSEGIPIIKRRLHNKKVLLILDDVDNVKQLCSLAGSQDWFGSGSRIIITTRNKHLLAIHGVEKIYEVKELNDEEALELFSLNAFKRREPDASYAQIANRVVKYAKGLPLALNVIGSDLFGKTIEEWASALKKYETIPSKDILDVLKVSYDNLDDNEKEIFLDIACFFEGNLKEDVEKTLDASRFCSKYGIGVLIDKSLVTISESNTVKMHDLIQDLGKDIARKDSPHDPGKRRRLWHHEDVLEVLTRKTGADTIEGIMLDMSNLQQEVQLKTDAFEKMRRLRILIVRKAQVSGSPQYLPNNLRFLEWNEYPLPSLPADFHPEALVVLNLPQSHLKMNEPFKKFEHLTFMNFSYCDSLTTLPDVSTTPNLTRLLLNNCPNLVDIHDSVGHLDKLVTLSTQGCPKLVSFPRGLRSSSLEYLNLGKCSSIQSFPDVLAKVENMKNIDIGGTAIKRFPNSIKNFNSLEELRLTSCLSFEDLPTNTVLFQNIEELNVERCQQLPKLLWKSLGDRTNWNPKLSGLTLKNCDLSDEDLELILKCFLKLKSLNLSDNNFLTIPACIEDLCHLLFLHVDNCKLLRNISVLPQYLQYIDARNCVSLTPQSSDVILSQAFQEVEYIDIVVFRTKIPSWFDHCSKGRSLTFWVRRKFPTIALFFLLGGEYQRKVNHTCEFRLDINGLQVFQQRREWPVDHVWLFDMRIHLTAKEWHNINEKIKSGWNRVEILCSVMNEPKNVTVKCCGIHLYKDRMNIHHVSFVNPDLQGSNIAHDNINDSLDIHDEAREDVLFPSISDKYFAKNILEFMRNLQSSKKNGGNEHDYGGELELNSESDNEDMEEEQHSASLSHQILGNNEVVNNDKGKDTNSCKILLVPLTETQEEPLATSIHNKELMLVKKEKLMENENLFESDVEATLNFNQSQENIFHTHFPERYGNGQGQQAVSNAEAYINIFESSINEDNMEAFYASLEPETTSLSHVQDMQPNNVSVKPRPSEETQKWLQILRDFVSKKFSLLLHPGRSGLMKESLNYFRSLTPDEGLSLRTKSAIQQLSLSFAKWNLDYNNANLKLESATADLSKAEKLKDDLKANVKEFQDMDMVEKCLCNQLSILHKEKRDLEEKINAIKAEIADSTAQRDIVAKRKRELFHEGRVMKAETDDLRNQVPRLKADEEWAKLTQANIEAEWSKIGEQFIRSMHFED
ncbi:TMV resistance protein N-like [Abrus precatorius]|uniref:TMV resistance protein N-like n=1 Tax=Abrus precatorius TaxID=3816 RepID=A0A8B8LM37_ABRPR|nr:TMV resistance protein N-like [Abrus precatorius]